MNAAKTLFLVCLLAAVGCNPERKLARLLMKYPELRDTLEVEAIVEYIKGDTVFMAPLPGDTVVYAKDRLTVKYVDRVGPTMYLEGVCAADTIRVDVPVIQPTKTVEKVPWWVVPLVLLSVTVALIALLKK